MVDVHVFVEVDLDVIGGGWGGGGGVVESGYDC